MPAPTTAFEDRVAAETQRNWCSVAEETTFLNALAAHSARVLVETVGSSVEARAIRRVAIGHPAPDFSNPVILVVGGVHGTEGAGREAALQLCGFLADTEVAGFVSYLSKCTWVFIPTANPDRVQIWSDGTRENANAVDVNRVQFSCSEVEAKEIQEQITALNPVAVLDLHEFRTATPLTYPESCSFIRPQFAQVDSALLALTEQICATVLEPAVVGLGLEAPPYPSTLSINLQTVMNTAALRGCIAVTTESARDDNPIPEGRFSRVNRVATHREALKAFALHHEANFASINEAVASARQRKAEEGRAASAAFDFDNGTTLTPQRAGFRLTSAQATTAAVALGAHGIRSYPIGTDKVVPAGQSNQPLIPFLLASQSSHDVVEATQLTSLPMPNVRTAAANQAPTVRFGGATVTPTIKPAAY